jgi:hypothetical protein
MPMNGANLGASSDSMIAAVAIVVGGGEGKTVDNTTTRNKMGEVRLRHPVLKQASSRPMDASQIT